MDIAKEACRDARGTEIMDSTMKDLTYALRLLRKAPAFTLLAILSLALGTGVNTAVFSVVYAVLLKPLPYRHADQLVYIARSRSGPELTFPEFEFVKAHNNSFEAVAGYRYAGERQRISDSGEQPVRLIAVTMDFLKTLGTHPAMGREFDSAETHSGGPQAIVISDRLWRSTFASKPDVLGRDLKLDNIPYTVVGVLPPDFWFPETVDALTPLRRTGSLMDTGTNTAVIARLRDGVGVPQAHSELDSISEEFRKTHTGDNNDFSGLTTVSFRDWLVGDVRLNLELLFGATGLLVLIACSNLASLLMTRLAARRGEFAVRLAIGGSTGRILRQLFIENFLLAGMGSIAGVASAYGLLNGLLSILPFDLPSSGPIQINAAVLAFTILVSLVATLLFTVIPFFSNRPVNCDETLKIGGRSIGGSRRHTRSVLVVTEVALSALLLIAAGLLINSLYRLHQESLGFNASGVVTVGTPVAREQRNPAMFTAFIGQMVDALRGTGISEVAATNVLPLDGQSNIPTQRYGHEDQSIGGMELRFVTPDYFKTMGIPVRQGRVFTLQDSETSAAVALVNETVVHRWWPDGKAMGDQILIGRFGDRDFHINDLPREVVGIVGDTKSMNLKDPARPTVYIPFTQIPASMCCADRVEWILKKNNSVSSFETVRAVIAQSVPANRIGAFRTMDDLIRSNIRNPIFNAWLFGVFAAVAVALAAIGIFGLLSYSVAQRRQEIGMRMALGASRSDVLTLVLRHGLTLITLGLAVGVAGALFLTRALKTLLYHIEPNDPLSYAIVIVALLAIGILASYIPARRATRIDPMTALRW
jgi:putative ABC transport system permease protein